MNYKPRTNKAFTLIELVVAIAILVMLISFAGVIFKVSINSHRTAQATAEIMQKLRAITDQLNSDFKGFRKDGYLIIHSQLQSGRTEYSKSAPSDFRADRLFYFTTGDFQSWFPPSFVRSNIAKVYLGHDNRSLYDTALPVSKWSLVRDVKLMIPGITTQLVDANNISYAVYKSDVPGTETDAKSLLISGVPVNIQTDPNDVRELMCRNIGEIRIEWTDGTKYPDPDNSLAWFGYSMPRRDGIPPVIAPKPEYVPIEEIDTTVPFYRASWDPSTPKQFWPKALRFTFKIYDSKGILKQGRTFTHIVYFGD